jgi:hypothetical protein
VDLKVRLAADENRFINRADEYVGVRAIVAQMRVIETSLRRRDLGELDDLLGRRVAARRVVESVDMPIAP